jgi:hypothetical protein
MVRQRCCVEGVVVAPNASAISTVLKVSRNDVLDCVAIEHDHGIVLTQYFSELLIFKVSCEMK